MQGFLSDCQKHEKSKSHMEEYKMLSTFGVSRGLTLYSLEQEERRLSGLMKR